MITSDFKSFLRSIVETLDQLGLLYAIGGSVASSIYGEARSTLDVDISVILPLEQIRPFAEAFQALGYYAYMEAIFDAVIARSSAAHRIVCSSLEPVPSNSLHPLSAHHRV